MSAATFPVIRRWKVFCKAAAVGMERGIRIRKTQTSKRRAPAHVVSFSALMTILLTFFILLCTMANEQECGLLAAGTGSFIRNIDSFGLPGLLPGHRATVDLGEGRPQFSAPMDRVERTSGSDADLLYRRVISIEPIRLPRALAEYFEKAEELRIPLNVDFERGSARLGDTAKEYLWPLLARVRTASYHVRVEAHVSEGFIFNEKYGNPWELSAARAAAVVRYFHETGGVSCRRMRPVGYGDARPLVKNPLDPAVNDRIELVILKH